MRTISHTSYAALKRSCCSLLLSCPQRLKDLQEEAGGHRRKYRTSGGAMKKLFDLPAPQRGHTVQFFPLHFGWGEHNASINTSRSIWNRSVSVLMETHQKNSLTFSSQEPEEPAERIESFVYPTVPSRSLSPRSLLIPSVLAPLQCL